MSANQSVSTLASTFTQQVVQGSARYWSTHFAPAGTQYATQALWCFAHDMDGLSLASSEVIAEKSVWWHEELTRMAEKSPRHPTLLALLEHLPQDCYAEGVTQALHEHLHGALITQQKALHAGAEAWAQYAYLRFGTLHTALSLISGAEQHHAQAVGHWAASIHSANIVSSPRHYADGRWLTPDDEAISISGEIDTLNSLAKPPLRLNPSSAVLVALELRARKRQLPSPLYTSETQGLRGMLTAWRAARQAS